MSQEALNSNQNIGIPHSVSFWFQENWLGNYVEFGDILVNDVSVSPTFEPFRSYRNGVNAVRKQLLTEKNATMDIQVREPNVQNLKRAVFGGTIVSGSAHTVYDARHIEVESDGAGEFVDLENIGEADFANITVTAIYAKDDVLEATNLLSASVAPDTDGKVYIDGTDVGGVSETVYVKYQINEESLFETEIFGASNATVEGAGQLQIRNTQGGVVQIWELASVNVSPNGGLTYALDAFQDFSLLLTLQERSGTFGKVYAK